MDKYFTKEQLDRLQEASHYFYTAVYENFKRGTMAPLNNLVAEEYFKATGQNLNTNWNCNSCCLNNYKTAGRLYFDSIKHWENQDKPTVKILAAVEETTNQEQNTPLAIVLDDTQQVQEVQGVNNSEAVVLETEPALNINELEKAVADPVKNNTPKAKPKGGRPKGSKNKKKRP